MLLLDTSALIELEHEVADVRVGPVRRYLGQRRNEPFACSTVTVGELAAGSDEERVRFMLRNMRKIALNEALAYAAGRLDAELREEGLRLGENDNWIAATALHYSATLVYCDGDFDRVRGLKQARLEA